MYKFKNLYMKKCTKCNKEKELNDFYNHNNTKDGKTHHCKKCMTAYRKANAEKQRLYMRNLRNTNNEKVKKIRRNSYRNTPPHLKVFYQSQSRAKNRNIEFNLQPEDIIVPDKCPYLKVPFIIGTKDNYQYTHSLDRIDNDKGYIKGNVEVISKKANSMKNNANNNELISFALEIIKRNIDKDIVRTMLKNIEVENKESLR